MCFLSRKGFNIVICIPLIVMDKIIGVMNLAVNREIDLDQQEIDLFIAIANQVALAASHAILQGEVEKKEKTIEFFRNQFQKTLRA